MQKHLGLIITVMALFSVLLFLIIIGPDVSGSNEVDGNLQVVQQVPNQGTAGAIQEEQPDINANETSQGGLEQEKDKLNVVCEIKEPKVAFDLKYNLYPLTYTYILIEKSAVQVRNGPSLTEAAIKLVKKNEKLDYIETVNNNEPWYHITWKENNQKRFGFVSAGVVTKRIFQFDKMHDAVKLAESKAKESKLTYIGNYQNRKGYAPLYHGQSVDAFGGKRSQSAPGYPNLTDKTEFSYISDGTLVKVLDSDSNFTKVSLILNDKNYYIPNKYIASPAAITAIKKAVVIDRTNQNEAVFEKYGEEWKVISYTLATTGTTGKYQQPTPLGYYCAMEKRERFYYYKDGTTKIQGYAPYVLRFSGGAYIHGVPVSSRYNAEGVRIDPAKIEYSSTIGTVPLSHKCVRNYTSHAKFLCDWYTAGETIVIIIE